MLSHLRALALFAVMNATFVASAHAQELRMTNPETNELATHSLGGPWAEAGVGMGMVVAAPVVTLFTAFALGAPLFACGWGDDDTDSERDEQCERSARAQDREAMGVGLALGIPIAVIGLGLVTHGAYRVRRIRQARRTLAVFNPTLSANTQHVQLSMTLRF